MVVIVACFTVLLLIGVVVALTLIKEAQLSKKENEVLTLSDSVLDLND